MNSQWKTYVLLHLLLFFNSFGGVCSKFAARQTPFSLPFFLFCGMLISILIIYAVCWQQIIKRMPLSKAYLNKPVAMLWGIAWGTIFFHERLTVRMIIGAIVVLCGTIMVVWTDV